MMPEEDPVPRKGVVSFGSGRAPKRATTSTASASTSSDPKMERLAKQEALQQQMLQRQSQMCERLHSHWNYEMERDTWITRALHRNQPRAATAFPTFPEEILEPWCPDDDKERDSGGGELDY
jgi:hypothetical protein